MIIVKMWGGLGNQMFQYATAKALAARNKKELKLDICHFGKARPNETLRHYRLNIFPNIEEEFADKNEINKIVPQFRFNILGSIYKYINKRIWSFNRSYKPEIDLSYSGIDLYNVSNVYLDGYWQSEKYFDAEAILIKECFNLDHLRNDISLQTYIKRIESGNSVSIHVRRGDFVADRQTNSFHGVCDLNYYAAAIEKLTAFKFEELVFFVFSDDMEWCKKNLKIPFKHFYIQTNEDYFDLFLMSICNHNIIANSSFSWWGAWLNKHNEKVVIAPQKWFLHQDAKDIIPSGWITN